MFDAEEDPPPLPDAVPAGDRRPAWADVLKASVRPRDRHISDDQIYDTLNAAGEAESIADLCAARGVTLPMYCVWKAKYRRLSLDELRRARRRELWRARGVAGLLMSVVAIAGAGAVLAIGRAAQAGLARVSAPIARPAERPTPAVVPDPIPFVPAPRSAPAIEPAAAAPVASPTVASPSPEAQPAPSDPAPIPAPVETGYSVQVAAAQTAAEGRALVEQLTAWGHRAYLYQAVVKEAAVFRVRVGPLDTLPEAEEVARQLQRAGYKGAWVVR